MQELNGLPRIPAAWGWSTISDACLKVQDGTHFSPQNQLAQGAYRYITAKNVRPSGLDLSNVSYLAEDEHRAIYKRCDPKKGDVLLVKDGVNTGDAAVNTLDEEFSLLSSVCLLRPRPELLFSQFLRYYLLSPVGYRMLTGQMTGTAIKRIILGRIKESPVPIAPLDEQRNIVAEIEKQFSRLDEAVVTLKRVKANLNRYKASVLKTAVEGELVSTERPWKKVVLGDIATSIRNGYSKKPDAEQGTRIFRISAVRPMKLDTNDVRYLSGAPADYHSFLIESGDVLFTRYNGSRDYVGVCARVPASLPPTVYPDKLIRVRVPDSMLLPEFLVILASACRTREYIESKIRTTAGQSGISGGDLKSLPLDIPRVEEQRQIVAEVERRLSVIEELETAVQVNLTRADRLRQSILQQAFSGGYCLPK